MAVDTALFAPRPWVPRPSGRPVVWHRLADGTLIRDEESDTRQGAFDRFNALAEGGADLSLIGLGMALALSRTAAEANALLGADDGR